MVFVFSVQWFSQSLSGGYFHPREYRARTQRVTHSAPCMIGKKEKEQVKGKSKVKREAYKELCAVCKERQRERIQRRNWLRSKRKQRRMADLQSCQ